MPSKLTPIQRWRYTLLAFSLATLFLLAGFNPGIGRETEAREDFSFDSHPVWQATDRADTHLEPEYWGIFTFVAGAEEGVNGNALDIEVLREIVRRHDWAMEDEELTLYFDQRFNWQVRRETTTGPWSIAETVRDIMDGTSPIALPEAQGGINWTGPDFANATQADVDRLMNHLLNMPNVDGNSYPYRSILSPDLCVRGADGAACQRPFAGAGPTILAAGPGEGWETHGFYIMAGANATRLFANYSKSPGSENHFEYYEERLDSYYKDPLGTHEPVEAYSLSALGLEIGREIESTVPLIGVSFMVMLGVLALFFRDGKDVAVSALGLGLLMLWIPATAAWLGYPQTQLSAMLPILLLALGVDFAIHSLHRWRKLALKHPLYGEVPRTASLAAAWQSIATLSPALGVATVTTTIAFGTATLSKIPDLREWGFLAAINIVQAYLLMGILVPVLRSRWAPRLPAMRGEGQAPSRLAVLAARLNPRRLAGFHQRFAVPLLVGFLLLTVLLSPLVLGNPTSTFDVEDYVDNDARIIRSMQRFYDTFNQTGEPGFYLVEGSELQEPATLASVLALEDDLQDRKMAAEHHPRVTRLLRIQMNFTEIGGPGYRVTNVDADTGLPTSGRDTVHVLRDIQANGTRNHLDPYQATFTFSPGEARQLYQLEGDKLVRLLVWFDVFEAGNWDYMEELLVELEAAQKPLDAQPGVAVQVAGPSYSRYVYVNEITGNFQSSLFLAIGASFIVLLIVLRNPLLSLIAITPIMAITIWLRGGMVLTDTSINLVTVQISSLAIGLGIDYAIHVVQRLREARREAPTARQVVWMRETMEETGAALSASAATDFLGFMILTLSVMPLFFMFGLIMALMIVLSLVAALLLLPPLLLKFGRLEQRAKEIIAEQSSDD